MLCSSHSFEAAFDEKKKNYDGEGMSKNAAQNHFSWAGKVVWGKVICKSQGKIHFRFRFSQHIADGGMCPNQLVELKSDFHDYSQLRLFLLEKIAH